MKSARRMASRAPSARGRRRRRRAGPPPYSGILLMTKTKVGALVVLAIALGWVGWVSSGIAARDLGRGWGARGRSQGRREERAGIRARGALERSSPPARPSAASVVERDDEAAASSPSSPRGRPRPRRDRDRRSPAKSRARWFPVEGQWCPRENPRTPAVSLRTKNIRLRAVKRHSFAARGTSRRRRPRRACSGSMRCPDERVHDRRDSPGTGFHRDV